MSVKTSKRNSSKKTASKKAHKPTAFATARQMLASTRAHCHPTFQKNRDRAERKEQLKRYAAACKTFKKAYPKQAREYCTPLPAAYLKVAA